jgi:aminoglycoside phosphotransferase (APT) family kinase protein
MKLDRPPLNPAHQASIQAYIASASPALFDLERVEQVFITPLPQGVWNFNYRVEINGRPFVFKLYSSDRGSADSVTTNSGSVEYCALRLVEPLQIAPRPVCFEGTASQPLLVYEFVEGEWFPYTDQATLQMAEVYSKLHSIQAEVCQGFREHDETPPAMLENIRRVFERYQAREDIPERFKARFMDYIQAVASRSYYANILPGPRVLLHADAVASNIIAGKRVYLIDWQTPMIGDPVYDIWAFFSKAFSLWNTQLSPSPAQKQLFLQTYLAARPDPDLVERLVRKTPFYLLQYGLHCSRRYFDFRSGLLPVELTRGRETNFEQYGRISQVILDEIEETLVKE